MLDVVGHIRESVDTTLRSALWGVIAAATGIVGLLFLIVAATIWLAATYDILTACVIMGLVFAVLALAATLGFVLTRRRAEQRARVRRAQVATQWWLEPTVLASGVQAVRLLGSRRATMLLVVAMASGFLLSAMRSGGARSPRGA